MQKQKGFTIVEMIVVMAVFLFIVGAGIGIFISVIQSQKKVLAQQQLLNQISYIEEYMSKALRMAKTDETGNCLGDPGNGGKYIYKLTRQDPIPGVSGIYRGIKFLNQSDEDVLGNPVCQEFFLDNKVSGDTSTPLILKELKNDTNVANAIALTSDSLKINFMKFGINGANGSIGSDFEATSLDAIQPRVTILLNIEIPGDSQEPQRTIQTTISRRNLNVLPAE